MCLDLIEVPFGARRFVELNWMLIALGRHIDMHIYVYYRTIDLIVVGTVMVVVCGEICLWEYLSGRWDILLWLFLVVVDWIFGGDTAHVLCEF
jgi:hypothetical protein